MLTCPDVFPVLLVAVHNVSPFYFTPVWPKSYHSTFMHPFGVPLDLLKNPVLMLDQVHVMMYGLH